MSQSGLSHSIRALETRLGLRLLTRTTRSVSPTAEGERLLNSIAPRFEEIEGELFSITELGDKPAGAIRITAEDYAIDTVLWPKLEKVLHQYPDIKVEFIVDYGLTDIVAERFDAGVRLGEIVSQSMISVSISPDQRMIVIGRPAYIEKHGIPATPQDLTTHQCINLRLPTHGGTYAWEFEKDGEELRVRVEGQVICNGIRQILNAAVSGYGSGSSQTAWRYLTLRLAVWSRFLLTGARRIQFITYSTRAADSRPQRSGLSLMRSGKRDNFLLQHVDATKIGAGARLLNQHEPSTCLSELSGYSKRLAWRNEGRI